MAPVKSEWTYYDCCWPEDPPIWSPDSTHVVYQDQDMDWWLVSLSNFNHVD
ncbi:MAG: hypothetical protein KJ734_10335 [Chloroflexi bacterium]|nr:hypothetical protein [Chloroflexota bacterium]